MSQMRYLRNSLFLSLCLLPLLVFCEVGQCWLTTNQDGSYHIECEGEGIIYDYIEVEQIVYTYGNCNALKEDFINTVLGFYLEMDNIDNSADRASSSVGSLRSSISSLSQNNNLPQQTVDSLYNDLSYIDVELDYIKSQTSAFRSNIDSLSAKVNSINCASCPTQPDGGGSVSTNGQNCCSVDFTEILSRLDEAEATRKLIKQKADSSFSALVNISNSLHTIEFLLSQGFGNTTNELIQIYNLLSFSTNLIRSGWTTQFNSSERRFFYMPPISNSSNPNPKNIDITRSPLGYSTLPSQGFMNSFFAQGVIQVLALSSLNNYFYDFNYRRFPAFTNTVVRLYSSATNHFSFFRDQVGVSSILSDYYSAQNSQYSDLTYYDFLTNHYIQASSGGTLSGSQATKTNWFSRIETLLAALVFSDSINPTNSVNTSDAQSNSQQVTQGLSSLNADASSTANNLRSSSASIISLYTQYCDIFDNAALPSRVVVFELSNDDHDVVSFEMSDSGRFSTLVDVCRAVTTFCWASVGIFLLFKFLVWAANCVFVASKFAYLVISKTFK